MTMLPIFPLGTVLLPGARLPLVLFEPRYVALLQELREREPADRLFGVVAIRRGHEVGEGRAKDLYDIGCVARVEAAEVVPDHGERTVYRVAAVGTSRFRVDRLVDDAGTPWTTAEVTALPDEDDDTSPAELRRLGEQLVKAFMRYRRAVGAPETHIMGPIERAAEQIVGAMPVGLADRQRLLEAGSPGARMRVALAVVQRENDILGSFRAVPVPRGKVNPN